MDRIYRFMAGGLAESFDELFELVHSLPWHEIISKNGRINVAASCSRSKLMSVPDVQSITKKAIIKKLQSRYRQNTFSETGETYSVFVWIQNDNVLIGLDACGEGLHKRGYRVKTSPAPLRETTAAALLEIIGYNNGPLADPFCGSGTIAIEGAMKAFNMAPGLNRSFESERWLGSGAEIWEQERARALADILPIEKDMIIASDISEDMLEIARYHAQRAGVAGAVRFIRRPVKEFNVQEGMIVTNPPYGARLSDIKTARAIYAEMGSAIRPLLDTVKLGAITPEMDFERLFGGRARKKRRVFNGNIQCNFYMYN